MSATESSLAEGFTRAAAILEGSALSVVEGLCVNLRGRAEHCGRCAEVCHADALSLSVDAVDLDDTRCVGCGACVPACPTGAFTLSGFNPRRFLSAIAGEPTVHLHCKESRARGGGVVIPCFRLLDARLVAAARADGVRTMCLHGLEQCDGCDRGGATAALSELSKTVAAWLGGEAPTLTRPDAETVTGPDGRRREDQPPFSRRDFLRFAGQQGADNLVRWVLPADIENDERPVPPMPFFQGALQDRGAVAFHQLLTERARSVPFAAGAPLPWIDRILDERCSACLACAERCPTGALTAEESPTDRAIRFESALCTDCGLCERVCPHDAVHAREVTSVAAVDAAPRLLMHWAMRQCQCCAQPYFADHASGGSCPQCRNEEQMDAEWLALLNGPT